MIKIQNINKSYKKNQVLFNLSLNIDNDYGYIYGLIGPNGSGKTTILKIMTGLLEFTSGSLKVDDVKNYKQWCKENMVLISAGERGLRLKNSVYDNVRCFGAMKGIDDITVNNLIKEYAKILNFEEFLKRRIETLSMGQKKKAMLLCGLCTNMRIIIMDEPSNGLDIDAQMELKSLIKMLSKKYNKTFIISSHDLDFLCNMSDKFLFMVNGKILKIINKSMDTEEARNEYIKIKGNLNDALYERDE